MNRLRKLLDQHHIKYSVTSHSPAYTAQEVAEAAHIPGRELAKTVMVDLDDELVMAVVPASYNVDLECLARTSGHHKAKLAPEVEFERFLPECEVGAMPPFGNLWDIPVYASVTLSEDERIAFCAGSHSEVVSLSFDDFKRLVEPKILAFSVPLHKPD